MHDHYQKLLETVRFLQDRFPEPPQTGLVLGTGLSSLERLIDPIVTLDYAAIPHFPVSTAPSHAGQMLLGRTKEPGAGQTVLILSGRHHLYEGYTPAQVVYPIQVLKLLGARTLILTNGSGCVNPNFQAGDYMLICDHLGFFAPSPCAGPNIPELGPRFFDLSQLYSPDLQTLALDCAARLGIPLRKGVYAYLPGPQYETPAEIRALRLLGADAVGMSTVPEAVAAAHCGLPVLALSHLANMAAGIAEGPVDCSVVQNDKTPLLQLLQSILKKITA